MTIAETVIDAIREMELYLVAVESRSDELWRAFGPHSSLRMLVATAQLHRLFDHLGPLVAKLQSVVTEAASKPGGKLVEPLGELIVGAQTYALLTLVDLVVEGLGEDSGHGLFVGGIRDVEEFVGLIHGRLAHINCAWHRCVRVGARMEPPIGGCGSARWRLYRCAIRQARRALTELGCEPDVAQFLSAGMARHDRPGLREACAQIARLLGVSGADFEIGPALLTTAPSLELVELGPQRPRPRATRPP